MDGAARAGARGNTTRGYDERGALQKWPEGLGARGHARRPSARAPNWGGCCLAVWHLRRRHIRASRSPAPLHTPTVTARVRAAPSIWNHPRRRAESYVDIFRVRLATVALMSTYGVSLCPGGPGGWSIGVGNCFARFVSPLPPHERCFRFAVVVVADHGVGQAAVLAEVLEV